MLFSQVFCTNALMITLVEVQDNFERRSQRSTCKHRKGMGQKARMEKGRGNARRDGETGYNIYNLTSLSVT